MNTLKFNRVVGALIIIALVVLLLFVLMKANKQNQHQSEDNESKFVRLMKRWQRLTSQIEEEMITLQRTREMKHKLERIVNRYLQAIKGVFIMFFMVITTQIYINGQDLLNAVLLTCGLISVLFVGSAFIFYTRFFEPNMFIKACRRIVRNRVYRKYGFNPTSIPMLQQSIQQKQDEANSIMLSLY